MLNRVFTISLNTFKEAVRDRVLYALILFSVLMILGSIIVASISAEQFIKIIKDIGLTTISLIGILVSVFFGMNIVHKEIDKRTVYNIFSKPVRRFEFMIGKYLGLSITLLVLVTIMSLVLLVILTYYSFKYQNFIEYHYGGIYPYKLIMALYTTYLEHLVLIALSLVFSSFSTPVMTVLFVLLVFTIGRFSSDILLFTHYVKDPILGGIMNILYVFIPHLDKLNLRSEAVYGGDVSISYIFYLTIYCIIYCCALLLLSIIIFEKKEFK